MSDRNFISRLVGVRFRDRGRDVDGLDCWGLVWLGHRLCGNDLPPYAETAFDAVTDVAGIIEQQKADWLTVAIGDERALDVALLWSLVKVQGAWRKLVCHVGLITGPAYLLHCEEHVGAVHVPFRDAPGIRAHPTVSRRIVSIHRHGAFA